MEFSESLEDDALDLPNGDPASYCRLCLSSLDVENLFPDGQGPRQDVIDRIRECTGIQITAEEDLKSSVCWMCSLSLEEFQCFRERCHRYDKLIRRKRKELTLPVIESVLPAVPTVSNNTPSYEAMGDDIDEYDDDDCDEFDDDDDDGPVIEISSLKQQALAVMGTPAPEDSLLVPAEYESVEKDVKPTRAALMEFAEKQKSVNAAAGPVMRAPVSARDPIRRFQCKTCGRCFKNKANLWTHNQMHTGKLPYPCDMCGTAFNRMQSLNAHKIKYHSKDSTEDPPLNLKCQFCPRVFPRNADRTQHMKMGHPDQFTSYERTESSTPTTTMSNERSTPVTGQGDGAVSKRSASATPSSRSISASPQISLTCGMCMQTFQSGQQVKDHIEEVHPRDSILSCVLCPKTFKSRQTLRMHILNHQGKLPYQCDDCGSRFDRRFYLMRHREKYHKDQEKKGIQSRLKCKYCPRIFLRKMDRKTHIRMVHLREIRIKKEKEEDPHFEDEEEFISQPKNEQAPQAEASPVGLTVPVKVKSELSFGCLQCGEQFPSAEMLKEHTDDQHLKKLMTKEIQSDIKPAVAPAMSKFNPNMPARKYRPRALNVRRPFKCPYCPKTFARRYVMKEHTFIHTGSLRFRCDECMAMFNRPHYLRTHKAKYHSENSNFKAMKCRFCTRSFVRKQDIRVHERIAHGVESERNMVREVVRATTVNGARTEEDSSSQQQLADSGINSSSWEGNDGPNVSYGNATSDNGSYVIKDSDEGEQEEEEDEQYEIPENAEIRDVVVTLERIPDDVLQNLDNSLEDYDYVSDGEDNASQSASDHSTSRPRINMAITLHRCPTCLKVFKTRKGLKHHLIYHQNQLPFSCDECGVQFARNRPLQVHKQRYHSEDAPYTGERFSCDYCPRIFLRDRDKAFHMKTVHAMERRYLNRDESTPELKKTNIKKKRKDFVCVACCERFETEKMCQRHINQMHAPPEPPIKSPPMSPIPSLLVTPKLEPGTEFDLPPNTDPVEMQPADGDTGVTEEQLSVPPISTSPPVIRPYKLCRCAICIAIFKNRADWNEHTQMHPNVRMHHCEQCLIKRKSRKNRKITSVGFKCQHCPKVFTKANTLRTHSRLHNSELRFPCDECGMMYDRYRLLQAHKERYHSEDSVVQTPTETFNCLYCPRTFMRLRDCKFHQEMVHAV